MSLDLVVARELEPVELDAAKAHARVDGTADDALVELMITAATDEAEAIMQRAVLPQTWCLTLDSFAGDDVAALAARARAQVSPTPALAGLTSTIYLQRPPIIAVTSIVYVDENGAEQTLDSSLYQVARAGLFGRVMPAFGQTWPATRLQAEAVRITFTCGWADPESVPASIKQWVLMRVKDLYDNRGAWQAGQRIEVNPHVDFMLDRWLAKSF